MKPFGPGAWRSLRVIQIFGANTGVGKTVLSTLLCRALLAKYPKLPVHYLKPVSTGPDSEADDFHIHRFIDDHDRFTFSTLFQFSEPLSPHLAAVRDGRPTSDARLLESLSQELNRYAASSPESFVVVETAGGVLSPAPSGAFQADTYRPFRFPTVLVGDGNLGGISSTVSAFESLSIRGYDVDAVFLMEDDQFGNGDYLREYFSERNVPLVSHIRPPSKGQLDDAADRANMSVFYKTKALESPMDGLVRFIVEKHNQRQEARKSLASRTEKIVWHPFTQHTLQDAKTILPIDSAYGDFFTTYQNGENGSTNQELVPAFDGSASWWTQGLGHGNPKLAFTAAYAAGRYGHVMFAGSTHEPAVSLAEMLLRGLQNPRLGKVFFSDNGSTGIEVAIKMGLKTSSKHYGWDASTEDIGVIGLQGSYHGDTIGAMDCSEPSTYNKKVEWYRGRGIWFDFPKVKMTKGEWVVEAPQGLEKELGPAQRFASFGDIFDLTNRSSALYEKYIASVLEREVKQKGRKFGALIMEPLILGAGGMLFSDPLFQYALAKVVRESDFSTGTAPFSSGDKLKPDAESQAWSGLPVICDEVFTGLYRLGRFSSSTFVGVQPDIAVHAKLLTGGLVPLCLTVASNHVYNAFLSDQKSDALLHGHSYTAHAVGCEVARESLRTMRLMEADGKWDQFKTQWEPDATKTAGGEDGGPWSMWSKEFVTKLSHHEKVDGVFGLGSVLVIALKDPSGSGYTSNAANDLRDRMLADSQGKGWAMHSRVLGNVIYVMASMTTEPETIGEIQKLVLASI